LATAHILVVIFDDIIDNKYITIVLIVFNVCNVILTDFISSLYHLHNNEYCTY